MNVMNLWFYWSVMMQYPVSTWILSIFPGLTTVIFGLPAWYWVSTIVALIFAFILASFIKLPLSHILAFSFKQKEKNDKRLFIENLRGPIRILCTLVIFLILNILIKNPAPNDATLSIGIRIAMFVSITYLFYRLIDLGFTRLIRNDLSPRSRIGLVLPLGRRVAKSMLIILAFLLFLAQFGVDVSAFLVGLGVGGLALALAAKNILENLFGGAVLSLDQPFQVGDYCKCGDVLGNIEEIGIRSTKIRTQDRTVINIPNAKLAEVNIENYNERDKIRLYTTWRLDLSTPLETIKTLLGEFERIILQDDNFYHDFYRIRLIGITDLGYEIEFFAFAKSTETGEFIRIREGLYFTYMQKMDELNVKFALPGQITYFHESFETNNDHHKSS
jgi:MscS family membrane protein